MPAFQQARTMATIMGNRTPVLVAIGLGVNVGDRVQALRRAIRALSGGDVPLLQGLQASSVYESAPLLAPDAPPEWALPFLNMVVVGHTVFSPSALLHELKRFEVQLGRQPRGYWAPREMDMDILLHGDTVLRSPALTIPHAQLLARSFVLVPLAELLPHWRFVGEGAAHGAPLHAIVDSSFPAGHAEGLQRLGLLEELS